MKQTGRRKTNIIKDTHALIIMIIISVIIRYLICGYTKTVSVYPDEMRYLSTTRSLAKYGTRLYFNLPFAYENLLYQIFLIPAAMISDKVLQLKMMSLTNCVLLSLGVIPVYLLAKRCVNKKSSIWLACIIYLLSSDFAYSCTYLRENLYLPLAMWVFYFLFLELHILDSGEFNKKTIGFSLLSGGFIWLLFFCKKTCFPIMGALVLYPIVKWIKSMLKHHATSFHLNSLLNIFLCLVGFFTPYYIMKYTVFYGDNINQLDIRKELEALDFVFGYYYFVYYIIILFLAYTFYPFLITFNERHHICSSTRHLFYFTLMALYITAFWVALNPNLDEDWGNTLPRIHLRYLMIFYEPLIICLLAALETENKSTRKKWLIWIPVGLIIWYLYYILIGSHQIVGDPDLTQQSALAYFALVGAKGQAIDWLIFAVLMLIGMILYVKRSRKFNVVVLVTIIGLNILNGALASCYYWPRTNSVTLSKVESAADVSEFIDQHPDKTFLIFTDESDYKLLWHTYIDETNILWLDYYQFNTYVSSLDEGDDHSWKEASRHVKNEYTSDFYDFDQVDYIIWPSSAEISAGISINMFTFNDNDGIYRKLNEDTCLFALKNTQEIPQIEFGINMLGASTEDY